MNGQAETFLIQLLSGVALIFGLKTHQNDQDKRIEQLEERLDALTRSGKQ